MGTEVNYRSNNQARKFEDKQNKLSFFFHVDCSTRESIDNGYFEKKEKL
jgi:hypothetical protein